jgi:cupin 2 domain-containing protein
LKLEWPGKSESCSPNTNLSDKEISVRVSIKNIFEAIPENLDAELFETIISGTGFRLERIVSADHSSPPGFWYDQELNELVLLLSGSAVLSFEGNNESLILNKGDYIVIPAHSKHRVERTDPDQKTFWLALHY